MTNVEATNSSKLEFEWKDELKFDIYFSGLDIANQVFSILLWIKS